MTTPNFFQIANSELTQDGFIQWLLEWANPKYKEFDSELHKAALAFVRLLLLPDDSTEKIHVSSVECEAQKNNIDVLALITDDVNNKKYAVIIEDKTDTTVHDNQLVRYSMDVKERYSKWELHCVYFKTGNESKHSLDKIELDYTNDKWVLKQEHKPIFKMVLREDILRVLKSFAPQNVIYSDFVKNQERIQNLTDTCLRKDKPVIVGLWGNTAWQGYYMNLESLLCMGTWYCGQGEPVINKKGTKVSAWGFDLPMLPIVEDEKIQLYLHLELRKLSIKARCTSTTNPKKSLTKAVNCIKTDMAEYIQKSNLKFEVVAKKDVTLFIIKRIVDCEPKQFIGLNYTYADLSYVVPQLQELYRRLNDITNKLKQESI